MEKETIQEKFRKDTIIGLDLNLKQFMEIVEPVNYTSKLSRWKGDKEWLESGGINKMLDKLKEIMLAVEHIRDYPSNADKANSKPDVVILDDNELSLACYAEEYPENFKEISESKQITKEGKE